MSTNTPTNDCSSPASAKATLYYNGACPLCRAEITKLQSQSDNSLCLINIQHMEHGVTTDQQQPDKAQLLELLHLKTPEGQWLTGLEANVAAWQHTPYGKYWRLLLLPPIKPIALLAYRVWLAYYRSTHARN